jgi:hypothetical protein
MTAATGRVFGVKPFGGDDPIPFALSIPLKANVAPFKNWLMGVDSSGRAVTQAAGVVGLVSAGFSDRDDVSSATDNLAVMLARQTFVTGYSNGSTTDALTAADYSVPFWITDNETVGKLSNLTGTNRSLGGLCVGLDPDVPNLPILYPGPIGWQLARASLLADAAIGGQYQIADAAASTATTERAIPRAKFHGHVSAIQFIGGAISADGTNVAGITISKRDGAGGSATSLGTYDTTTGQNGAITAFVPAAFTLSSTSTDLDLLETDILTVTITKGGSGQQLLGVIRVIEKVG